MKSTIKKLIIMSLITITIIVVVLLISYAVYTAQMQEVAL